MCHLALDGRILGSGPAKARSFVSFRGRQVLAEQPDGLSRIRRRFAALRQGPPAASPANPGPCPRLRAGLVVGIIADLPAPSASCSARMWADLTPLRRRKRDLATDPSPPHDSSPRISRTTAEPPSPPPVPAFRRTEARRHYRPPQLGHPVEGTRISTPASWRPPRRMLLGSGWRRDSVDCARRTYRPTLIARRTMARPSVTWTRSLRSGLGVCALGSPTALSMTTSQSHWRPPAHWVARCGCQTVTYLGRFPGFVNRCRIGTSAAVVPIVALIPERPRG